MPTTSISVIVPNYRHAAYLPARLDTILNQTRQDFQLILLDDASDDQSREILRAYAQKRAGTTLVVNETNSGSTFRQWNKGVSLAQGELIWIAESDDIAQPTLLEKLAACLEQSPDVGVAFCRSRLIDSTGNDLDRRQPESSGPIDWDRDFRVHGRDWCRGPMLERCLIPTASATMFRKRVFLDAGGAQTNYRLVGDWATWFNLLLRCDLAYLAEPLCFWRTHEQTVRSRALKQGIYWQENLKLVYQMAEQLGISPDRPLLGYHLNLAHQSISRGQREQAIESAKAACRLAWFKPYPWKLLFRAWKLPSAIS